jgi:hypothetical protein
VVANNQKERKRMPEITIQKQGILSQPESDDVLDRLIGDYIEIAEKAQGIADAKKEATLRIQERMQALEITRYESPWATVEIEDKLKVKPKK